MRNIFVFFGALLFVDGVFGVDVTVSVMKGDSVTLKPLTEIPERDSAQWKFGDKIIAKMNKATGRFSTSEGDDVGFKGRLNLDHQTGSLTITNITTDHAGLYTLKISTTFQTLHDIFSVTVSGKMTTVSVKEGEPIFLHTGLIEIKGYDLIMWKFEDQLIAEINKGTNQLLTHDTSDERFNGRLKLCKKSGSLTISDSETTDSGDYNLNMTSSTHTVQRNINVTVSVSDKQTPDPGLSSGAVIWIVVAVLLGFAAAAVPGVIYSHWKISKIKRAKGKMMRKRTDQTNL